MAILLGSPNAVPTSLHTLLAGIRSGLATNIPSYSSSQVRLKARLIQDQVCHDSDLLTTPGQGALRCSTLKAEMSPLQG